MKTFKQFLEDKEYTAIVRDGNGHATKITSTSRSMKQFKQDLRGNGYRVMSVAPADTFGSSEWEQKLYSDKEKRKQRKWDRVQRDVDANNYANEKVAELNKRYEELWNKYKDMPSDDPKKMELSDELNKAYDAWKDAKEKAVAEYKANN